MNAYLSRLFVLVCCKRVNYSCVFGYYIEIIHSMYLLFTLTLKGELVSILYSEKSERNPPTPEEKNFNQIYHSYFADFYYYK